jgi:hypothetical protein
MNQAQPKFLSAMLIKHVEFILQLSTVMLITFAAVCPVQRVKRIVSHALVGGLQHQYARIWVFGTHR